MTRFGTDRNNLLIIGTILLLMFTGCTMTKRYHFSGFSMGRNWNNEPIQNQTTANTKLGKARSVDRNLRESNDRICFFMDNEFYGDGPSNGIGQVDFERQGAIRESGTRVGEKFLGQNLDQNSRLVTVAPRVGYMNVTKPAGVTYFDATDPESWAIVFYCLFIFLGILVLISNLMWLKVAAIASLLLAIICTVLCEGEFYYAFTKAMAAITSAVLVFLGIREDLF